MPKRENYAVAEIAGKQIILEPGKKVKVPKLDLKQGAEFKADKIMYLRQNDQIDVGKPYLKDVHINTVVAEHDRDEKVIVYKKKRRNRYQVKKGHRQSYTLLEVKDFSSKKSKPTAKKETQPKPKKTTKTTTKAKAAPAKSQKKTSAKRKTAAPKKTTQEKSTKATSKSAESAKSKQTKEKI